MAGETTRSPRARASDVARLAGVSAATVSYVLNGKASETISEPTRRRVLDAVAQLGYRPSPTARSLRVGRSDVVLGLLPDLHYSPAFQRSLHELALALRPMGLSLVVHPTPMDSHAMRALWRAITPACVFAFTSLDPEDVETMHAAGVRVAVACSANEDRRPWELKLGGDDVGRAQAEHLIAAGHTHVGLALPVAPAAEKLSIGRRAGIQRAMTTTGQTRLPVRHLPWDPADAAEALASWLADEPHMTAIAAWNDDMGALILSAAATLGLTVPRQLAVIGAYDSRVATLVRPPLTTVQVDLTTRMHTIARAIQAVLEGDPLPSAIVGGEPATVIARDST